MSTSEAILRIGGYFLVVLSNILATLVWIHHGAWVFASIVCAILGILTILHSSAEYDRTRGATDG